MIIVPVVVKLFQFTTFWAPPFRCMLLLFPNHVRALLSCLFLQEYLIIGVFNLANHSNHTTFLESTQTLREMNTMNIPRSKDRPTGA
jgi:hypothetical protein